MELTKEVERRTNQEEGETPKIKTERGERRDVEPEERVLLLLETLTHPSEGSLEDRREEGGIFLRKLK